MTFLSKTIRTTVAASLAWLVVVAHASAAILVTFDQSEYVLANASTPLLFDVVIDADDAAPGIQPLAEGLFSIGLRVEFSDVKAEAMSPAAVAAATPLDHFGPLIGADVFVAPGEAALRGNTPLPLPGNPIVPYTGSSLATFTLDNLAAPSGSYGLSLDFYKPLGPTEDSFVDGLGATLDPQIVFGTAVVTVGLPGDYNQNGVVDAPDYTLWRDSLGSTVDLTADGDGQIDQGDYQVWRDNFGATTASTSAATPEPTALAMLAAALAAVAAGTRGRSL